MKNISKKISCIIITFIFAFINIFVSVRTTQVFAGALPDPMAIEETFRVIEGGLQNITYSGGHVGDVWSLGNLIATGAMPEYSQQLRGNSNLIYELMSADNGTQNIAWEEVKNVCVVEPAKLAKYIMWDKPQEYLPTNDDVMNALSEIAQKTGAGVTMLSKQFYDNSFNQAQTVLDNITDAYISINDNFISPLKNKLQEHTKGGNRYYPEIENIYENMCDGLPCHDPHIYYSYISGDYSDYTNFYTNDYYPNLSSIQSDINNYENYSFYTVNERNSRTNAITKKAFKVIFWNNDKTCNIKTGSYNNNLMMLHEYNYRIYKKSGEKEIFCDKRSSYPCVINYYEDFPNYKNIKYSDNIPNFDTEGGGKTYFLYKEGQPLNAPKVKTDNVVVPIQYPQTYPGIITVNPYAFQDLATYAQTMAQTISGLVAQNNPDNSPEISPLPYTPDNPYVLPEVTPTPEVKPYVLPSVEPEDEPVDPGEINGPGGINDPSIDPTDNPSVDPSKEVEPMDFDDDEWKKIHFLDLSKKFPFCIPFDLIDTVRAFKATPKEPAWDIPIKYDKIGLNETVHIDFRQWEKPILFFRGFVVLAFIVALILITKKMLF